MPKPFHVDYSFALPAPADTLELRLLADTTVVEAYIAGGRAVLSNGPFVAHSPLWGQAWLSSTGAARVDARAWAM